MEQAFVRLQGGLPQGQTPAEKYMRGQELLSLLLNAFPALFTASPYGQEKGKARRDFHLMTPVRLG